MGRYNGSFRYKNAGKPTLDEETGFRTKPSLADWRNGCECQIERSIPAKQIIGVDGQAYSYTYNVFIPKLFSGEITVGTELEITSENGDVDTICVRGVDSFNRRYTEIWG